VEKAEAPVTVPAAAVAVTTTAVLGAKKNGQSTNATNI